MKRSTWSYFFNLCSLRSPEDWYSKKQNCPLVKIVVSRTLFIGKIKPFISLKNILCVKACFLLDVFTHVTMATDSINSVVRGHHVYKDVWTPFWERNLSVGNLYMVALNKPGTGIVGHVEISALCNAFLLGGGVITCIITGNCQYLLDHPQGS